MTNIRAALQELHDAVHEQFFGHDTELPPRLIKAWNDEAIRPGFWEDEESND